MVVTGVSAGWPFLYFLDGKKQEGLAHSWFGLIAECLGTLLSSDSHRNIATVENSTIFPEVTSDLVQYSYYIMHNLCVYLCTNIPT